MDFIGLAQNGKSAAHVYRGVAVAAGQQDRQLGPDRLQMVRKAETVHFAGHHDVGEDEVNAVELDFAQRRFGIRYLADGVAELFEQAGTDGCDLRIVLDQQHGAAAADLQRIGVLGRGRGFLSRQQDRDPGALAEFARHLDRPAGLDHDRPEVVVDVELQRHRTADGGIEYFAHRIDAVGDIDGLRVDALPPRECQQLAGEGGAAFGRPLDRRYRPQAFGIVANPFLQRAQTDADYPQKLNENMRT